MNTLLQIAKHSHRGCTLTQTKHLQLKRRIILGFINDNMVEGLLRQAIQLQLNIRKWRQVLCRSLRSLQSSCGFICYGLRKTLHSLLS
ncbi:hypothetical protein D3C78_1136200 [compost metagenome]